MMLRALGLAAALASVASAERNTTWRYGVAGPECEALLLGDDHDYVPLNATHGDLFFAHALVKDTGATAPTQLAQEPQRGGF